MCRNSQACRTCWVSVVTSSSQQKSQTWPHHLTSLTFWLFLPLTLSDPQGGGRVGVRRRRRRRRRWSLLPRRLLCLDWRRRHCPESTCSTSARLRHHCPAQPSPHGEKHPILPNPYQHPPPPQAHKNLPICQQKYLSILLSQKHGIEKN